MQTFIASHIQITTRFNVTNNNIILIYFSQTAVTALSSYHYDFAMGRCLWAEVSVGRGLPEVYGILLFFDLDARPECFIETFRSVYSERMSDKCKLGGWVQQMW